MTHQLERLAAQAPLAEADQIALDALRRGIAKRAANLIPEADEGPAICPSELKVTNPNGFGRPVAEKLVEYSPPAVDETAAVASPGDSRIEPPLAKAESAEPATGIDNPAGGLSESIDESEERPVERLRRLVRGARKAKARDIPQDEHVEPSLPLDPASRLVATTVRDYILGKQPAGYDVMELLANTPAARNGLRLAMYDKIYLGDTTCRQRLERIAADIGEAAAEATDDTDDALSPATGNVERPNFSHANCRDVDPALFFPDQGASTRKAREVCAACVVRTDCLEYALYERLFGIWGGTSERQRQRIRHSRRSAKVQVTFQARGG